MRRGLVCHESPFRSVAEHALPLHVKFVGAVIQRKLDAGGLPLAVLPDTGGKYVAHGKELRLAGLGQPLRQRNKIPGLLPPPFSLPQAGSCLRLKFSKHKILQPPGLPDAIFLRVLLGEAHPEHPSCRVVFRRRGVDAPVVVVGQAGEVQRPR